MSGTARHATAALAGLALVTYVTAAQASLIGDTVFGCFTQTTCDDLNFFDSDTATVEDPGIEFTESSSLSTVTADLTGDTIEIAQSGLDSGLVLAPSTFEFSDLDWLATPGEIVGVTDLGGDMVPFTPTISFTDDSVTIGLIDAGNGSHRFQLVTQHVPEPGPLALWAAGLAGVAGVASRSRRTAPGA